MNEAKVPKKERTIHGIYCDTQNQTKSDGGADYFLDFLDCVYKYGSKQQTRDFYFTTKEFIKEKIPQPEQLEFTQKLNSFITISDIIVPKKFLELIPEENRKRKELEELYQTKSIENSFDKNTDLLGKKVKQIRVIFENGFVFSGDSETFSNNVTMTPNKEGGTDITIKSKIKDF